MRRARLAAAVLCVVAALLASGCGGHSKRGHTHSGELSVYTSLPFEGPYGAAAQAVYDGELLALAQTGGVVNGTKVVLRRLDDAVSSAGWSPVVVDVNARIAAADPSTIAYIGELTPGSSQGSIPTLSRAGILQVTPGDSATSDYGKTFARVVPSVLEEAASQLAAMSRLGVKDVYLVQDRTTYGRDLAAAVRHEAASDSIAVLGRRLRYLPANPHALVVAIKRSKAGALLYAGSPEAAVATLWNALSAAEGTLKKFASATVTYSPSWADTTAAARYNTFLSAPGLLPNRGLPRAGSEFESDFVATYGSHWPWESGIFGYVAMSGILEALHSLGPHPKDLRARMVFAFMHIRNLPSALGTYSIAGGQTSFQGYYFTSYNRSGEATPYIRDLP